MKRTLSTLTLAATFALGTLTPATAQPETTESGTTIDPSLSWSERMSLSEIHRLKLGISKNLSETATRWGYVYGLVLPAINDVSKQYGKDAYYQISEEFLDRMVNQDGTIKNYRRHLFNIDYISAANVLFYVYDKTGEERYKQALDLVRSQLDDHPRVYSGGFWHKEIYTNQMWLDGLYMGTPFYAHYETRYGDGSNFEDVARQLIIMERQARDPATGLLYHGWDSAAKMFWADPITGVSKNFWGRGMGWYAMALVDTLDYFPEDHSRRPEIIAILNRLAESLAKVQDPSGVWWQVLDMPDREGNYLEATGSNMFAYAILKGIRQGNLDTSYLDMAAKAWQGIHKEFITVDDDDHEVHMHKSCAVAGLGGKIRPDGTYDQRRDGTFEYYINEPLRFDDGKATGPFIRAALEIETMSNWLPENLKAKANDFIIE